MILTNTGLTDVSEALNNVNNGCYYAICFIKDTNELYTHGKIYDGTIVDGYNINSFILSWYNSEIDKKIVSGFVWKEMPIWLSSENQFNYKAAYDLAVTFGGNLPCVFKFGTTDNPIYYEFQTTEDLSDFYLSAMSYINKTLAEGWIQKDSIDWSVYDL